MSEKLAREPHYEISVWTWDGDVVKKVWDGTEEELAELREQFDGGLYSVVIDREWEEEPSS